MNGQLSVNILKTKVYRKIKSEKKILNFLSANILYTLSSFLCPLTLPFLLVKPALSGAYFLIQSFILLTSIFELGLSVSFLKYQNHLDKQYAKANEFLTLLILFIIIGNGLLGNFFFNLIFHTSFSFAERMVLSAAVAGCLAWTWNRLTQINRISKFVYYESIFVFAVRIALILYFYFKPLQSAATFFLFFYFLPHAPSLISRVAKSFSHIASLRFNLVHVKKNLGLSLFSYIEGVLYTYAMSYFIIYAKKINLNEYVIGLGFSYSLIGLVSLFTKNYRLYYIGVINADDPSSILSYLDRLKKVRKHLFKLMLGICVVGTAISYLASHYVFNNYIFILCAFFLLLSFGLTSYYGLYTLLANHFGVLRINIIGNVIRLSIIVLICNILVKEHPFLGFMLCLATMTAGEMVVSKLVVSYIHKKLNNYTSQELKLSA